MSALGDHVDRLTHLANTIRSAASSQDSLFNSNHRPNVAGPFTRAVLTTPLGDLIRDIDPSELGLFTLVQPPQLGSAPVQVHDKEVEAGTSSAGDIARVGFVGATPLKRPPTSRDGMQRPREHEPEVYAQAALKYLDKYDSIRPMPRAVEQVERIIEELAATRESIDALSERLLQTNDPGTSAPPVDPKSMAKEEEHRIQELQSEIADLRKHKETLLKKRTTGIRSVAALTPKREPLRPAPQPLEATSPDAAEHSFWNTPAAAARTLHFTDDSLLTDEIMDLSAPSLASPLTESESRVPVKGKLPATRARQLAFEPRNIEKWSAEEPEDAGTAEDSFEHIPQSADPEPEPNEDQYDDDADEDDMTIMLKKAFPDAASLAPPLPERDAEVTFELPSPPPATATETVPAEPKKQRFKITQEMEAIVSKIWTTIGEVIMPGNPFDLNGSGIGVKPPRSKETITHLQQLSLQTTSPGSPSTSISSISTQPSPKSATTQQILIAHVLLSLLSFPPSYSLSLNRLKETLASKNGGVTAQAVTRPIYSCVAKRLLKIERGGGEQIVRFDI